MNASPPELHLRIGAAVTLWDDGGIVRLSPAQQAYLLLLADAEERGLRRERVIRLLWDEDEGRTTRHRIRQLNYSLGRRGRGSIVEPRGTMLVLSRRVRVEWMPEELGRGLSPPTPAFHDRLAEIREERELTAALGSARELDSARLADVPDGVLRVLREGHRAPGAWRDLLWALLRTGRVREAEFELRRVLGDDVSVEGFPVARRIAAEPERVLSLAAAGGDASLPLLGRDQEVRHLSEAVVAGSTSILVTGVRGVGRSRILGQSVATLLSNEDDVVVLGAYGMPFERHVPFGGLGQLLNDELLIQAFSELGQPETEVIRRALPVQFETEESHVLAQLGGPGSYLRVARSVTELFHRAFGNAAVILVVDDLDRFDRSSLEVVTRLTTLGSARLLATWCTEGHTSQDELLFRFQGLEPHLVPLGDLSLLDAQRLCRAVAPELGLKEAEDIARLGGGRPGRIVELIRALRGSPILAGPMGPSLDEILRRRIREISDQEQQALAFMAVNGGRMEVATLGALMGTGILVTSGYVRTLEEAGLVRMEGSRASVVPSLLTGFVERELPPATRRETHATIAAQLMRSPERADPGSIGHHLMESDQPLEAASWFRKAGLAARDRTAYAEAIVHLEKGLATVEQPDPDIAKELGALHAGMGDFRKSIHWYGRARIGYLDRGDREGDVEAALHGARSSLEANTDRSPLLEDVRALLLEARELDNAALISQALDLWLTIADYGHDWSMLHGGKAELLQELRSRPRDPWIALAGTRFTYLGDPVLALGLSRTAFLGLRGEAQARSRALSRLIICSFTQAKSRDLRASVLLAEAERISNQTGDLYSRFALLSNRALWTMDLGDWDDADRLLHSAARFIGAPLTRAAQILAANRAVLSVRRGNALAARAFVLDLDSWRPIPQESINSVRGACCLMIELETGRLGEARQWFDELARVDLSFPFSSDLSIVPLARASYLVRVGRTDQAGRLLHDAADSFRGNNFAAALRLQGAIEGRLEPGFSSLRRLTA